MVESEALQKDLQSKKRIKTGRTAPKSSEAGRPVLFLAENSVPLYCFSSEFLLHGQHPSQSQVAAQPALRLRFLLDFGAAAQTCSGARVRETRIVAP